MSHGSASYFSERSRSERRVSLLTVAVGLFFLVAIEAARVPIIFRESLWCWLLGGCTLLYRLHWA